MAEDALGNVGINASAGQKGSRRPAQIVQTPVVNAGYLVELALGIEKLVIGLTPLAVNMNGQSSRRGCASRIANAALLNGRKISIFVFDRLTAVSICPQRRSRPSAWRDPRCAGRSQRQATAPARRTAPRSPWRPSTGAKLMVIEDARPPVLRRVLPLHPAHNRAGESSDEGVPSHDTCASTARASRRPCARRYHPRSSRSRTISLRLISSIGRSPRLGRPAVSRSTAADRPCGARTPRVSDIPRTRHKGVGPGGGRLDLGVPSDLAGSLPRSSNLQSAIVARRRASA